MITLNPDAKSGSAGTSPDTGPSEAGHSYYGAARRCLRLFTLKYRSSYPEPPFRGPALGSLVHGMLAWHYDNKRGHAQGTLNETVEAVAEERKVAREDVDLAREVYAYYITSPIGRTWKPLAVEQEYRMAFVPREDGTIDWCKYDETKAPKKGEDIRPGHHILYTAREDLTVEDEYGKIHFVDHKTAFRITKDSPLTYGLSGQVAGLRCLGPFHYGDRFGEVLLSFIQTRTGMDIRTVKAPSGPRATEDYPRLIISTAMTIAMWDRLAGENIRAWPMALHEQVCLSKWGACGYSDYCLNGG